MPDVKIHFVGANLYVPSTDKKRILVVIPNATRLGRSPEKVADGSTPATHRPILHEKHKANYEHFLGSRLLLDFGVSSSGVDPTDIEQQISAAWFEAEPSVLGTTPGDSVAAQILLDRGRLSVTPTDEPCLTTWSPLEFGETTDSVVPGLTLIVEDATRFVATADRWVIDPDTGATMGKEKLVKIDPLTTDVEFTVGNQCAEDILDWGRNSMDEKAVDQDFRWLWRLSKNPSSVADFLLKFGTLPAPLVTGSKVDAGMSVNDAFATVWKGGGNVGCECQGCVAKVAAF